MENEKESTSQGSSSGTNTSRNKKFLVFNLGDDRFAIPLSQVKEVIGLTKITPLPDVPKYFKGLINLRGRIISTLDLRTKLGFANADAKVKKPCIVISEVSGALIGTIVDDVTEVIGIQDNDIERQLNITSTISREYITGVAKFENRPLTLLLDIAKVLNVGELTAMRNASNHTAA